MEQLNLSSRKYVTFVSHLDVPYNFDITTLGILISVRYMLKYVLIYLTEDFLKWGAPSSSPPSSEERERGRTVCYRKERITRSQLVTLWVLRMWAEDWKQNTVLEVPYTRGGPSHVYYAWMNIPETKKHQYNNWKCCAAKIMMGLGGFLWCWLTSQK